MKKGLNMDSMENELRKKLLLVMAQKRVEQIKDFYTHLMTYCTVNILFLIFWFFGSFMPETFWKPAFICMVGIAGFAVLAHGIFVFGAKYVLPKGWEEKQFKKLMNKEKQQNKYE